MTDIVIVRHTSPALSLRRLCLKTLVRIKQVAVSPSLSFWIASAAICYLGFVEDITPLHRILLKLIAIIASTNMFVRSICDDKKPTWRNLIKSIMED